MYTARYPYMYQIHKLSGQLAEILDHLCEDTCMSNSRQTGVFGTSQYFRL